MHQWVLELLDLNNGDEIELLPVLHDGTIQRLFHVYKLVLVESVLIIDVYIALIVI